MGLAHALTCQRRQQLTGSFNGAGGTGSVTGGQSITGESARTQALGIYVRIHRNPEYLAQSQKPVKNIEIREATLRSPDCDVRNTLESAIPTACLTLESGMQISAASPLGNRQQSGLSRKSVPL